MAHSPITHATRPAVSTRYFAAGRATAARSACWWTGTRWQSRTLISASQASLTAPIIASLPTPWIPKARSSTRSKSSKPTAARWSILASPTTMDRSNGRPTAVRFSMFGLMKTTVHAACWGTQLAPTGPMISSMRRMMPVSFGLSATQDRRFLLLSVHDHETAEVSLINAANPSAPPRLVAKREPEHDYSVDHHEGRLIILTNSDGAEDYRIVEAPAASASRENAD